MNILSLEDLGYNEHFKNSFLNADFDKDTFTIAKVTSQNKGYYGVINTDFEGLASLTGKLIYASTSSLDLPCVGDFVVVQQYDVANAFIHEILPRKTLLKRKSAGKTIDFQLIAANIDFAFIIQSLDTKVNIRRIERYLSSIHQGGIEPILLLSKSDLVSENDLTQIIQEVKNALTGDIKIIPYSITNKASLDVISEQLVKGKTYCLLGISGAGKSSLTNSLLDASIQKTTEVRQKDFKGKHTTTGRQMIFLKNGAMIIDTPGIREFGSIGIEQGINDTFEDIYALSSGCKFSDCTHTKEAGCAVLAALNSGNLEEDRYTSYIKLLKENAFNEMSYYEKRKADKTFGKMVKEFKKHKKKY